MPCPRSDSSWNKSANTSATKKGRMEQADRFDLGNEGALQRDA
jgi:hypothetical protein